MNGKGDRSTQEVSFRSKRLTRRLTLADPAVPRSETDKSKLVPVSSRHNHRHAALRGHGTLADGRAGGLRETKSEAIQTKRKRLAGQRHTVTSLGWLRYRFDAHPPAHSTVRTAMGSVSFPAFAFSLLHFPCPAHEPPPDTGTPACADGLRRSALAFVAGCFLPHGLKPSGSVAGNRETQRFGFFKARWAPGRQSQA